MSDKIKTIFMQMLMISTGVIAVMAIEGIFYHLSGYNFQLEWYHPISVLVTGVVCSVPSLLLTGYEEWPKKKLIVRLTLHAIVMYAVVIFMGYLFKWYTILSGFLFLSLGYVLVYGFVWGASLWVCKRDEKEINAALEDIRDEE